MEGRASLRGGSIGPHNHPTHLPEQNSQQQEDEDSHQQTDGNDPAHHIAPRLQVVQGFEDNLGGKAEVGMILRKKY